MSALRTIVKKLKSFSCLKLIVERFCTKEGNPFSLKVYSENVTKTVLLIDVREPKAMK